MTAVRRIGWFGRDARQGLGRPASWVACALSVPLLLAALVIAPVSPQAGAAETPVISETFTGANVATPSSWVEPTAPSAYTNGACLTAGTAAASPQQPIPGCANPAVDSAGAGASRLTGAQHNQEGGVMTKSSVPASSGLDATFESYQWGGDNGATGSASSWPPRIPRIRRRQQSSDSREAPSAYASGHAVGAQGLAYGYLGVGLDVLRELFEPRRGRLGLYRSLVGHGPDPRSGRRAGPGQRGRRLLRPEQLGRRRRFPGAPWEHSGRVRGARRSGHQHHEQPRQHDRQRLHR